MKAKALTMSILTSVTMLGGIIAAQSVATPEQAHAATSEKTVYVSAAAGATIYTQPNGTATGRVLKIGTAWKSFATKTVNGVSWTNLGGAQWVKTATVSTTRATNTVRYIDYVPGYSISVYSTPNGKLTGTKAKHGTAWNTSNLTTAGGRQWVRIGAGEWIPVEYTSTTKPTTKYVKYVAGYSISTYYSANGTATGKKIKHATSVTAFQTSWVNGVSWTNIGYKQWVKSAYLAATKPVSVSSNTSYSSTGKTYHMVATAYDPRVLGNTTFGYDTVAANLSRFPRGTKMKITFANGTSKIYTVRDTGGFAYSNSNQLDIAMPNAQCLRFGRQSITVTIVY